MQRAGFGPWGIVCPGILYNVNLSVCYRYQDVCFSNFDFKHPANSLASSFLQIIWKDTTKFGIAKSFSNMRGLPQVFVAAVYRSPGNVDGFYHENISKGRFKKSYCKKVQTRNHIHDKNYRVLTTNQIRSRLTKEFNASDFTGGKNGVKCIFVLC